MVYEKTKVARPHFCEEYEYMHWEGQARRLNTKILIVVIDGCWKKEWFNFFFPVIFSIFQNVYSVHALLL